MHNRISCEGKYGESLCSMSVTLACRATFLADAPLRQIRTQGKLARIQNTGYPNISISLMSHHSCNQLHHRFLMYHWSLHHHYPQIRCDNSCPLQSYTPNNVIISKFERLAQKFPQTAKLVEVGQEILANKMFYIRRWASPHWASVSLVSVSVTMSKRRGNC